MKKFISVLIGLAIFVLPLTTLAQGPNLFAIASDLTDPFFKILVAVALLFILYSAFTFITAGEDPGKIETAKSSLAYALLGLLVAFMAKAIGSLFQGLI